MLSATSERNTTKFRGVPPSRNWVRWRRRGEVFSGGEAAICPYIDRGSCERKAPTPTAVVHHADGDNKNNSHTNLVVCDDQGYHLLIHMRINAYDACGNANWRKCPICKEYDDPALMKRNGKSYRHAACIAEYNRRYKQ